MGILQKAEARSVDLSDSRIRRDSTPSFLGYSELSNAQADTHTVANFETATGSRFSVLVADNFLSHADIGGNFTNRYLVGAGGSIRNSSYRKKAARLNLNTSDVIHFTPPEEGNTLIVVERTAAGLMSLLGILAPGRRGEILEARPKLLRREGSDLLDEMLDTLIVTNLVNSDGRFSGPFPDNGQADILALRAMSGDPEARREVDQLTGYFQTQSVDEEEGRLSTNRRDKPLHLQDLVAVHATSYAPERSEDGERYTIKTFFDSTDWDIPRCTIHWALNHHVASHMYGSWGDKPIVVIVPLEQLIDHNQLPTILNTVDTVFSVSPGRRLQVPSQEAVMVRPGLTEGEEIFKSTGHGEVRYRCTGFTPTQVSALTPSEFFSRQGVNGKLTLAIIAAILDCDTTETQMKIHMGDSRATEVETRLRSLVPKPEGLPDEDVDILSLIQEEPLDEVLLSLLNQFSLESQQKEKALKQSIGLIERQFSFLAKLRAVNHTIEELGYTVQPGGMWAWGGSMDVTSQTSALAAELGTICCAHSNHPTAQLEEFARRRETRATERLERFPDRDLDWTSRNLIWNNRNDLPQAQLRAAYLSGLI